MATKQLKQNTNLIGAHLALNRSKTKSMLLEMTVVNLATFVPKGQPIGYKPVNILFVKPV